MKLLHSAGFIIAIVVLCNLLQGCSSRTYQHDREGPNGITETYYYHSLSIASDTAAEGVRVTTKEGVVLEVYRPVQDNDSLKVVTPYGVAEME